MRKSVICKLNSKYHIFNDGRVYSTWFGGRFLKPNKVNGHWVVGVGNRKRHQVARLVMFHFGNHNYEKIEDMPLVTYKDGNVNNLKIENLKFTTAKDVIKKTYKKYPKKMDKKKIKDTKENILNISKMLKNNFTLNKIAKEYNVSDMSVHRFINRNNLRK